MTTYILWIGLRIVNPVRPVDDTFRLLPEKVLIGGLVKLLDLLTAEDQGLNSPVTVLDVVDLGGD